MTPRRKPGFLRDCGDGERCPPDQATFTVSRTGPTTEALEVYYRLQGTADNGVDYRELPFRVTIPVGESSATVAVEPLDDTLVEGTETVILQLLPWPWPTVDPSLLHAPYVVGNPHAARVVILDNDPGRCPTWRSSSRRTARAFCWRTRRNHRRHAGRAPDGGPDRVLGRWSQDRRRSGGSPSR